MDNLLKQEIPTPALVIVIPFCAVFYTLWGFLMTVTLVFLDPDTIAREPAAPVEPAMLIISMITMPILIIWEELFFRVPISLMARWGKASPAAQLLFVVAVSGWFGSLHSANTGSEIFAMLVQGVGGIMLGLVYLASGGYNGKVTKPLLISYAIHVLMNWMLMSIELGYVLMN